MAGRRHGRLPGPGHRPAGEHPARAGKGVGDLAVQPAGGDRALRQSPRRDPGVRRHGAGQVRPHARGDQPHRLPVRLCPSISPRSSLRRHHWLRLGADRCGDGYRKLLRLVPQCPQPVGPNPEPAAVPGEAPVDDRQRHADRAAKSPECGAERAQRGRGEQRRGGGRDEPEDGCGGGHGVEPDLRPQCARQHVAFGRQSRLLQLHAEGPRGVLSAALAGHLRVLRTGIDDEGGDVDGGLQPQAVAHRLRLSRGAVP